MDSNRPPQPSAHAGRLIGLAGGIASGKSTVASHLASLGAPVLDADQLARAVVAPGQPALAAIASAFGAGFLTPDGALDRKALGTRVFGDPQALATLNAITHPAIRARVEDEVAALARRGARWVVYEAALLAEDGAPQGAQPPPWRPWPGHPALSVRQGAGPETPSGHPPATSLSPALDELVVVTAPAEVRLRRILARDGLSEEQARARLASQATDAVRLTAATISLRNAGDERALRAASQALYDLLVGRYGPPLGSAPARADSTSPGRSA